MTAAKMTPKQRQTALELIQRGMSKQTIADRFGVSYWTIHELSKRSGFGKQESEPHP